MRKLAKIAAPALAAIAALGAIVPTAAQAYPGQYERGSYDTRHEGRYDDRDDYRTGWRGDQGQARSIRNQIDQLQRMVERRDGRGRISEREAAGLRHQVWNLRQTFRAMNRDGLNRREARILQERIEFVRDRLNHESRDRDGRRW